MKSFLLIICICICTGAFAQSKAGGAGGIGREELNSLKLSNEQKKSIEALMKEEQILHKINMEKLNKILTEEQKKKLAEWIKKKAQEDSTPNSKNHTHD